MASQFELSKVPKRHLRKSTMYVERLQKEQWEQHWTVIWHLDNFMELKETVVYTNKVPKFDWNIKLKKKGSSATATINTLLFIIPSNISCCVLYDENFRSERFDACPISTGLYKIEVPESAINSANNCRLNRYGTLSLQFEYCKRECEYFHSNIYQRDYRRPVTLDVGPTLKNHIMTDFTLKPEGSRVIECHKALLAARSIFFRNYFNEICNNGNELPVYVPFDILHTVVRYLYDVQCVLKLHELRDIIQLTWELDIPSMKSVCNRCVSLLKEDSFEDVKEEGIKNNLEKD